MMINDINSKLHKDTYYYNIIRKNIRKFRKIKKMTQKQLAMGTHLSEDYIGEIESISKEKGFSIATLGRIADALEIDIKNFFVEN